MMSPAPAGRAQLALVRAALLSSLAGPLAPHPSRASFPAPCAPFCLAHDVLAWTRIALISSLAFSHASHPLLPRRPFKTGCYDENPCEEKEAKEPAAFSTCIVE
ncbi:hypothetical protein M885DRAFT_577583 [Pelagophyceae sp. CCMP2097]|nr:hypothetical protein M885DRAFT_577583 [Pelagophyceae sp. CCMP2097]